MKEDRQHTFSERGEEGKGEQKHVKPPKGRGWKKERERAKKERKTTGFSFLSSNCFFFSLPFLFGRLN